MSCDTGGVEKEYKVGDPLIRTALEVIGGFTLVASSTYTINGVIEFTVKNCKAPDAPPLVAIIVLTTICVVVLLCFGVFGSVFWWDGLHRLIMNPF